MANFLENALESFIGGNNGGGTSSGGGYGNSDGPPSCPPPWRAQWDDSENRWVYVNEETGERTHQRPQDGYGDSGRGEYQDNSYGGGAMGAAAEFAGYESGRVEDDYDREKYRVENDERRIGDDVEDFPEDAARWTGRKVQEVEDVPEDVEQGFDRMGNRVEQGWDNTVQDVEDVPQDIGQGIEGAASWVGEKVEGVEMMGQDAEQDVDRFGDNLDNAYDQGKAQERNDGW